MNLYLQAITPDGQSHLVVSLDFETSQLQVMDQGQRKLMLLEHTQIVQDTGFEDLEGHEIFEYSVLVQPDNPNQKTYVKLHEGQFEVFDLITHTPLMSLRHYMSQPVRVLGNFWKHD